MLRIKLLFSLILCSIFAFGQVNYTKTKFDIKKELTVYPAEIKEDYEPKLTHLEAPQPGGSKHQLLMQKRKAEKQFPRTNPSSPSFKSTNSAPVKGRDFPVADTFILPNGDTIVSHKAGGIPNDNTLAISNAGLILASFNSKIFTHNLATDSTHSLNTSLHAFSGEFTNSDKYDPKTLYDPINDRFILVFLNGRLSTDMRIIVAFSTTNDPADPWNLYAIPGNPYNDTTWTDYPAIAINENELFLTGNLLKDNQSWQTGFSQTVIWQIDLQNGYDGDTTLTTQLWGDIEFDNKMIRNLDPVQGGSAPVGDDMYLLSNRNFSLNCDSLFLVHISGSIADINTALTVQLGLLDTPYGMPPNGRQDYTDSLATNDARVLGAYIENDEIQFVGNTMNHQTGFAGIYHGFITDVSSNPQFSGRILSDDSLDFGYPNIVFSGTHTCSRQSIIGFNHSSPWHYPGFSTLQYNSDDSYSQIVTLKEGEGIIDRLNGTQRWGDYFGIQRYYPQPNQVWMAGFYGRSNVNYTWVTEAIADNEPTPSGCSSIGLSPAEKVKTTVNTYPNPTINLVMVEFNTFTTEKIDVALYSLSGKLVKTLYSDLAKEGKNQFSFSTTPLANGTYILSVKNGTSEIVTKKIIKH